MTDPDYDVIRQASLGDDSAFKTLYDRYLNRVYGLLLRISVSADMAEELTQEVFIKAWRNLGSFKFESKFYTWLHRIAVNEFLSQKRFEKRTKEKMINAGIEMEHEYNKGNNSGNAGEISIDLEHAIEKLPEQQRAAFVLHDVEGYRHEEIAEMMNIAEGTSKSNLHRARKFLREELRK